MTNKKREGVVSVHMGRIDEHCLKIIGQYQDGKISRQEADEKMKEHGDKIMSDILINGAETAYTFRKRDFPFYGTKGTN